MEENLSVSFEVTKCKQSLIKKLHCSVYSIGRYLLHQCKINILTDLESIQKPVNYGLGKWWYIYAIECKTATKHWENYQVTCESCQKVERKSK